MLNTNDCSAAWRRKRASRCPGKDCPAVLMVGAASARAEKRFELFTGNSVEPSSGHALRGAKASATGTTSVGCARCTCAPRKIYLLSGLTSLLLSQATAAADGLSLYAALEKRSRLRSSTASNISSTIAEHGVRDAAKKCVSSVRRAGLNLVALSKRVQHRASKSQ